MSKTTDTDLRAMIATKISALKGKSVRDPDNIAEEELLGIKRLLQVLKLSLPKKDNNTQWGLAMLFILTAILLTGLLFVRLKTTPLEIIANAEQLSFVSPKSSVLLDSTPVESLAISMTGMLHLPNESGSPEVMTGEIRLVITRTGEGEERGKIQLGQILIPSQATVCIAAATKGDKFRIHLDTGKPTDLAVACARSLIVQANNGVQKPVKLVHPSQMLLTADSGRIDVEMQLAKASATSFGRGLPADSLSFFESNRFVGASENVTQNSSSIISGVVYFSALDGQRQLRPAENLRFDSINGVLEDLTLKDNQVVVRYICTAKRVRTGVSNQSINLMPSALEWLRAQHAVYLLWGAVVYCFGILAGLINWFRRSGT